MSAADQIRERVDIVDHIGQTVDLKRSGQEYVGMCPFPSHGGDGKKPSFFVNADKGVWICRGKCSEGGDVFDFTKKMLGVDFMGAVEHLAEAYNIPLSKKPNRLAPLREKMVHAQSLFSASLPDTVRAYLLNRGYTDKTIQQWGIGFVSSNCSIGALGKDVALLKKCGLVRTGQYNNYVFGKGRITFPIRDRRGHIIAFGYRLFDSKSDAAKYLNSPNSDLFQKSDVLYGIHHAKQSIVDSGTAVLVEGYPDVNIPHQHGFKNVLGVLGLGVSAEHVKQLTRIGCKLIIIALDGDGAGRMATVKRLPTLWESPIADMPEIRIADVPVGDDPDTMVRRSSSDFQSMLDTSLPAYQWYAQNTVKVSSQHQLSQTLKAYVSQFLIHVGNPIERDTIAQFISSEYGVRKSAIDEMVSLTVESNNHKKRFRTPPVARQKSRIPADSSPSFLTTPPFDEMPPEPDYYYDGGNGVVENMDAIYPTHPQPPQAQSNIGDSILNFVIASWIIHPHTLDEVNDILVGCEVERVHAGDFQGKRNKAVLEVIYAGGIASQDMWESHLSQDVMDVMQNPVSPKTQARRILMSRIKQTTDKNKIRGLRRAKSLLRTVK